MGEYITPPSLPPTTYCRRLLIPNTPEWVGTVTGALMSLIYESEWKQTTGITAEEAANRAREMFNQYLASGDDGECGDMACCDQQVILNRFNPETGRPEISVDGGVTWTESPSDTQNAIMLYPPPVTEGGTSTKCDAATNASEHFNDLITSTGENLTAAASIFELAVAVAEAVLGLFLILVSAGALTAPVTAVATAIWAAATGLFTLGITAYNAYWSTDKKDAVLCAMFCRIGDNGQFTEDQYQAWRSDVKSTLPASPALDIIMTAINAGGARGLSQMASYGNAADADCTSCECDPCDGWDFRATNGGWENQPTAWGNPAGEWTIGIGWVETYQDHFDRSNTLDIKSQPMDCDTGHYDYDVEMEVTAIFGFTANVELSISSGAGATGSLPNTVGVYHLTFDDFAFINGDTLEIIGDSAGMAFKCNGVTITPH